MAETDIIAGGETAYYRALIQQYDKQASKWVTRGKRIIKRYLDERSDSQATRLKYNILWSNVENLKPAIYAQTPKPEVERRFLDKDPVGRVASDALERCLRYYLGATPFGSTMRQARNDYLLIGRGVTWVRYVPTIQTQAPGTVTDDMQAGDYEPLETVAYEEVLSDYVHWRDFGHNVARTWEEVFCVWRIVYMTREQMQQRGFADWNTIPLDYTDKELKGIEGEEGKKATIYEIWDKNKRKVFWIAKAHDKYLDQRDDPLELDKFFPCSEPIYATLSNDSLIPVPDYSEYQDQAEELDELTNRIGLMQKAIKAAGVYDASIPELPRLLSEGCENKLIPVSSWAALNEKGGLKNAIELLPMQEVAQTLLVLYETREKVLGDLYQITGLSDLIRGDTKASETATAQQIKNNFINLRLSEKQREMQRLVRNTIEIMGNIIARHFTEKTIKQISGLQLFDSPEQKQMVVQQFQMQQQQAMIAAQQQGQQPPPPQPMPEELQERLEQPSWAEVMALLRDSPDRCFRIDIETDSTVASDQQAEQQQATQFVQAIGGFIQQAEQASQNPDLAVFLSEMLGWAVRRFPISRDLQGAIDTLTEKMAKQAQQPQQPKPDPAMAKIQADGQAKQAQMQQDAQLEQQRMAGEMKLEQMRMQMEQQAETAKAQREAQMELLVAHTNAQAEQQRMAMEMQQASIQAMFDKWKAELDARTKIEIAEVSAGATLQASQVAAAAQGAE